MTTSSNSIIRRCGLLAAGFVSNRATGGADLDEGFGLLLLGVLLGAFCGLVFGILSNNLIRFVAFLTGKHVNGNVWTICCVVFGAILFAWLTVAGGGEEPEVIEPPSGIVKN